MYQYQVEVSNSERIDLPPFTYTPGSPVNVVLGNNGSGKTSLLTILSLFPIERSSIGKDGFIRITIKNDHHKYTLTTTEKTYSFIKDDDTELNMSGNISMQYQLVEQYFSVTKELLDLFIDRITFSKMTPIKRRGILELVSKVDYGYMLGIHESVTKESNKVRTLIKYENERLEKHVSLHEEVDLDLISGDILRYGKELDTLLTKKQRVEGTTDGVKCEIDRLTRNQHTLTERLDRQNKTLYSLGVDYGLVTAEHRLKGVEDKYVQLLSAVREKQSWMTELSSEIDKANMLTQSDPDEDARLLSEQKAIMERTVDYRELRYTIEINNVLQRIKQQINDSREDMEHIQYCRQEELHAENLKLNQLSDEKNLLSRDLTSKREKQTMYLDAKKHVLTCPKCEHNYHRNYDEVGHMQIDSEIRSIVDRLEVIEEDIPAVRKRFETLSRVSLTLNSICDLANHLSVKELSFLNRPIENIDTKSISSKVDRVISQYKQSQEYHQARTMVERLELQSELRCSQEQLLSQKVKLEQETKNLLEDKATLRQLSIEKNGYEKVVQVLTNIKEIKNELQELRDRIVKENERLSLFIEQEKVDLEIRRVRVALSDAETLRNNCVHHTDITRGIKQEIQTLQQKHEERSGLSKQLMEIVSESMYNFSHTVVTMMNGILEQIWEEELILSQPTMDKGKLTYRFPLIIDGKERKDINEGSKAMCAIVDLAFKLTVLELLDMKDYPIMLDEIGDALDKTHQEAMTNLIEKLSESRQVFIVSQHADVYQRFAEATSSFTVLKGSHVNMEGIGGNINESLSIHN